MQHNSDSPLISVVIPVKNGLTTIESCLQGILSQTLRDCLEIIIIDSGSTDGTCELISEYPIRLHKIPAHEFNHGDTRNLGARLAHGQFIVMTVQDATAADSRWLERMLQHFEDPQVAGVCGVQIVSHEGDKNPVQWFRPIVKQSKAKRVHFKKAEDFVNLPAERQLSFCGWDDVNAMYRRAALIQLPFRCVTFAEDALWCRDALMNCYALVYEPRAQVYHYHHETFSFAFSRTYTIQYHFWKYFRCLRPLQFSPSLLPRHIYWILREQHLSPGRKVMWIGYNMRLAFAVWCAKITFSVLLRLFGERATDRAHNYFCGKPPQAIKSPASKTERKRTSPSP